ncbi:MAG TPA: helix-turn-helix domain-containing protein [Acidimicrobiales bacterium]|nr:helix-turn-helix domain-containing protein [Acidimicrobiales bacterium]
MNERRAAVAPAEEPPTTGARARILEAAVACFTHFGNDKTTINDVARVARLSRQTVYRHFPGRTALLEAVQELEEQRLRREADALGAQAPSLEAFLTALIEARASTAQRYRTRQHLIEQDRGLFQSLFLSSDRRVGLLRDLVAPQLRAARRRGELRADVDLAEAAEWVAITVSTVPTLTDATSFDLDDPAAVGRFYARHICRGLLAAPARAPGGTC